MCPRDVKEAQGLNEIKKLTDEYTNNEFKNELTEKFLLDLDDKRMLQFLRGRKYNAKHAWETLKRNGEVRLKYPDIFPETLPSYFTPLQQCPVVTFLKTRDKLGRRIMFVDSRRWDPDRYTILDLAIYGIFQMEKLLNDEDAMKNGLVVVEDCCAYGMKHIKQFSVTAIRQCLAIFWFSYPIKFKAVYFVNTPYPLACALSLAKYFFPQKFKERLTVWPKAYGYTELLKIIPPEMLPKVGGGMLEEKDCSDPELEVRF